VLGGVSAGDALGTAQSPRVKQPSGSTQAPRGWRRGATRLLLLFPAAGPADEGRARFVRVRQREKGARRAKRRVDRLLRDAVVVYLQESCFSGRGAYLCYQRGFVRGPQRQINNAGADALGHGASRSRKGACGGA
jgi:hypothetical protein